MIRLRQVQIGIKEDNIENILRKCSKKLNINQNNIINYQIRKKSLDARKKPNLYYSYEIDIEVENERKILSKIKSNDIFQASKEEYKLEISGKEELKTRPVIIGSGPCGMFCAYLLAESGYKPIIIERGEKVEDRVKTIEEFWTTGNLKENSNVQFGEGGAGTFSDGKLNTLVKDTNYRQRKVLETFVKHGAPEEILYLNKPHIGTDILRKVIKSMREEIISNGGEFKFNECLTDIKIENNKLTEIEINNNKWLKTNLLVLAIGHSARDTFKMLYEKKLDMMAKPFAVGIRIQHPQDMINKSQYGEENYSILPPANYKLTYTSSKKRGVYTFCMCPGGYVVNSSSEENKLAINGMSNYKRESKNANSAVIVTVTPNDFGSHPLAGIEFQRKLEMSAYKEGNGKVPIQLYKDFKEDKTSTKLKEVEPIIKGNYSLGNINNILPKYITESLIEGIDYFNTKIKGYNRDDAILAAVESRTSSPVRIIRNEQFESNIKGILPAGEGAGYAGGITSAAIDGIKIAEQIAKTYKRSIYEK